LVCLRPPKTSFQKVKITLIRKPTYFHGGSKVEVEEDQLAPDKALAYFHTQCVFSLLLSTWDEYPPLSMVTYPRYWMECPFIHFNEHLERRK